MRLSTKVSVPDGAICAQEKRERERGAGRECTAGNASAFSSRCQINDGDASVGWISSCLRSYHTEDLESPLAMDISREMEIFDHV